MDQNNSTSLFIELLKPDEIIEFLDQQTISEEKATGLRLLRRAAQTIQAMMQEREQYFAAITERDQAIQLADQERERINRDRGQSHVASPDQLALQEAVKFGYALVGLSYRNGLPEWVVKGAQDIIDYSETK